MIVSRNPFEQLPSLAVKPEDFEVLHAADTFRTRLLEAISKATSRIYLVALYLEDDEAGREISQRFMKRNSAILDWTSISV